MAKIRRINAMEYMNAELSVKINDISLVPYKSLKIRRKINE